MSATNNPSEKRTPILGCIADDVTGATDLAINLVQGGMRVLQVLGVPDEAALAQATAGEGFDAVVVALRTRSCPPQQAVDESVAAIRKLQQLGDLQFYFKYCSTFDSTPQGNIGPVAEAMQDHLGVDFTIYCPAFPQAKRTVYRGHLFVGDRPLNESGMKDHPLTPMTDANIVRVLSAQTTRKVGLFNCDHYVEPPENYAAKFEGLVKAGTPNIVIDICTDEHLRHLAKAARTLKLVTGGSGLARYLPTAYRAAGRWKSREHVATVPKIVGRSLIIAGSCSPATNAQVAWMQSKCPTWPVDVAAILDDAQAERKKLIDWAKSTDANQPLMIFSTAMPDQVSKLQSQFGRDEVATAIEGFLASVARSLIIELNSDLNIRHLVIAGGETSGAIVSELGIQSLSIGAQICTGVPWTESLGDHRLALALKSGNFGEENFFQTALEMLP